MSRYIDIRMQKLFIVIDNDTSEEIMRTTDWEEAKAAVEEDTESPGYYLG